MGTLILHHLKPGECSCTPPNISPSSPQPPTIPGCIASSIPKLLSRVLMDGPCWRWMHPGTHSLGALQGRLQLRFPGSPLFIAQQDTGRGNGGNGQGGHCHRPPPQAPAQPCSCSRAVGAPGFPMGENGSSTGRERKDKKKRHLWQVPHPWMYPAVGTGRGGTRCWALPRAAQAVRPVGSLSMGGGKEP